MGELSEESAVAPDLGRQEAVDELFSSTVPYWRDIYDEEDVDGWIFRRREAVAAGWASALAVPPDAWAVEVGCGAGRLAARLAEQGIAVQASDRTERMVRQAQETVAGRRLAGRVTLVTADAQALPWADGRVPVLMALGLLPWLPAPEQAVAEMARVLRPGGHLVVTADNSVRLSFLFDPSRSPVLGPLRRLLGRMLRRARLLAPAPTRERYHRPRQVDRLLRRAGLRVVARTTVGFGPFTMLGRPVLSNRRGLALQERLQRLADRRVPVVRSLGNHYVVLAEKPSPAGGAGQAASSPTAVTATRARSAP